MDDLTACITEATRCQAAGVEISDGCARTIASMYHEPGKPAGPAFSTSGAISDPSEVWQSLFGKRHDGPGGFYRNLPAGEQLIADMLGTYLVAAGRRGPVPGWSSRWVGR